MKARSLPLTKKFTLTNMEKHNTDDLYALIQALTTKLNDLTGEAVSKPKYYSKKEVQEMLGIGKNLMEKYIADGYISYSRPDGDKLFFRRRT